MTASLGSGRTCIFISYRRDDARGASGRVWDWLRIGFGRELVFRDVASIGAGKWQQKIEQALAASKACVAVIGRRWADATNLPRLQDPGDMVRHELETALACGERDELTVIPLLVEDAQLSHIPADQLPESLRPLLADWNVLALSESGWDDDTRRLIEAIAAATHLPVSPELEEWMARLADAQRGLSRARGAAPQAALGREGEEQALEALLHQAAGAEPEERPALKAALAALAAGDTRLAEEWFERELEARQRVRRAARQLAVSEGRREADVARNVASLALVRGDLIKALRYLRRALEANPEDLMASLQLGYALISLGDLTQAQALLDAVIHQAGACEDPRQEARGFTGRGDVLMVRGDVPAALSAYQASLQIRDSLAKCDPANTQWQRDLFVSKVKIGDVLVVQGDSRGALAAYQAGLAITEELAKRDPANTEWQRDLYVSKTMIGNVMMLLGDGAGALAAYQAGLSTAEGLAKRDPENTQWQRDLSVSNNKIGDVRMAQGDSDGALAAYQVDLAIAAGLAQRNPANTQWQRDLSVSHQHVGDVLRSKGDSPAALAAYQASLQIRESLAKCDPANTQWQRDLFVSKVKIGDVLVVQGDSLGALAAYQAGLVIAEDLAKRDPANTEWQRDLYVSKTMIGDVLMARGDKPGALAAYQASLLIRQGLAQRDPANTQWQSDLSLCHQRIGDVLRSKGDDPEALAAYQASLVIAQGLARRDPANTQWQRVLSVSNNKIGDVLMAQGDSQGALAAYQASLHIRDGLAKRNPANTGWQRDLSVGHDRFGDVLVAQGDSLGALAAYQAGLQIREGLANRDPANTQWQVDVAISCSKLGSLESLLSIQERREYLSRGLSLLSELKQANRLHANQDWSSWFEDKLRSLT
jgi:predicted negative regulator of RcsB-dependent stress response